MRYEQQFKRYRVWCLLHGVKPGHADSLKEYMRIRRNMRVNKNLDKEIVYKRLDAITITNK